MNDDKDDLRGLRESLTSSAEYDGILTSVLAGPIPDEVCNVVLQTEKINQHYSSVFLGYDAIGEAALRRHYENRDDRATFFGAYDYLSGYRLTEDMQIFLENSLDEELEEPVPIDDLSRIVPLFAFQGDYIVVDLGDRNFGALLTVVEGHIASFLAPGILAHIDDLAEGLREGTYREDDGLIVFPSHWYQRTRVRAGELSMDEYGEVS